MDTEIIDRSETGERRVAPPVAQGEPARADLDLGDHHVADAGSGKHLADPRDEAVVTLLEVHAELDAGRVAGLEAAACIGDRRRQGFVAQYVLPGSGGGDD